MANKHCPNCFKHVPGAVSTCQCGFVFFRDVNGVLVHYTPGTGRRMCPVCRGWVKWRDQKCGCGHQFPDIGDIPKGMRRKIGKREMVKIGFAPEIVERARAKVKTGNFRDALDEAIGTFLPVVDKNLQSAGFSQRQSDNIRIWPVSISNIEELDEVASKYGVPRTDIIRAVMTLFADTDLPPKPQEPE